MNTHLKTTLLLFFLCFSSTFYAQESLEKIMAQNNDEQSLKEDFNHTWKGISGFYTAPLKWKKKQFIQLGLVATSFTLLTFLDEPIRPVFQKQKAHIPTPINQFGTWFGGPINAVVFSGGLYTYGFLAKNKKIKKTGILLMASIGAAGFLQTSIKTMVGRARPSAGRGNHSFSPFSANAKFHSFPSGHAVVSIVFAHSIASQIDNVWAKVAIYSVGAITPVSRLWNEAHWFSDVALGSFLGILTVNHIDKYLTRIYDDEIKKEKKLTNMWKFNPGLASLNISYTFN